MKEYIVHLDEDLSVVLERQDEHKIKTLIVVARDGTVEGTISDGDLRRYILNYGNSPKKIIDALNKNFFYVTAGKRLADCIIGFDLSRGVVPILDKNKKLVDIYDGFKSILEFQQNTVKRFTAIAPTRISLAGGGSDVSSWFSQNRGKCINAAIDIYARVNFEVRNDDNFHIRSINTGTIKLYSREQILEHDNSDLIINCLKKFPSLCGINLDIYCDFDPGSGLGGSSSLCVAVLRGCTKLTGAFLTDFELQSLAYEVERIDTKILGGWQDQIASVHGGLSTTIFDSEGIKTSKLFLSENDKQILNNSFFLFKVGSSRSSSAIHEKLNIEKNEPSFINSMEKVVLVADEVEKLIQNRNFDELGPLLDKGWKVKRNVSDHISNENVNSLYTKLINFGADGGRLLGAGGSGFILVFVNLKKQPDFISRCVSDNLSFRKFQLDMEGSRIIGEQK